MIECFPPSNPQLLTMKNETFESLGQYHDSWATIILCAPDRFPEYDWDTPKRSQAQRLEEAFVSLQAGAHLAEKKLKEPRLIGVFPTWILSRMQRWPQSAANFQQLAQVVPKIWIKECPPYPRRSQS